MIDSANNAIQMVTFAAPYPANYGGVIDVYYKIKALHDMGVQVHLHAFVYGEHLPSRELERLCASVHYYHRAQSHKYLKGWPYVVSTRYNKQLIQKVKELRYPVILEGLHSCFLVEHLVLSQIPFVVRMHNVEWKYYRYLAELELSYVKKKYFLEEARRLKNFEKIISQQKLISISEKDTHYFEDTYPGAKVLEISAFHAFQKPIIQEGMGEYALFNGNLSINENEQAALWLIEKVFSSLEYPLIIAGKQPSAKLVQAVRNFPHIRLEINPSDEKMNELMQNAHMHLLPNRQPTGIKLKWVNALFTARYIITHPDIISASQNNMGIYVANDASEYKKLIQKLSMKSFSMAAIQNREEYILKDFENMTNVKKLMNFLIY